MRKDEVLRMQVRLFRLVNKKWNKSIAECADIFDKYDIDGYIRDVYESFHVQGDDTNLEDIGEHLQRLGCIV